MDNKKTHYLIVDSYNRNKGHHITIDQDGRTYYNQAIKRELPIMACRIDKSPVPGFPQWVDYYEDEPVTPFKGNHGYQEYIDQAKRAWLKERPLEINDVFNSWVNQADREHEVIAIIDNEALCFYQMPKGRCFIVAVNRSTKCPLRNYSINSLPKKWLSLVDKETLDWIDKQPETVKNFRRGGFYKQAV